MKIRYFLFLLIVFGLPHTLWIPQKLGLPQESIPLGLGNLILIAAALLWLQGRSSGVYKNPIRTYNFFLYIILIGVLIALITQLENNTWITLKNSKQQISLMLLYFIPFATIKNEKDFLAFFVICLFVDFIIGYEVTQSGVLSGIHFSDQKRGSGPFGEGWRGADVAGSYLAQMVAFPLAALFTTQIKAKLKCAAVIVIISGFIGILATYGRGAILSVVFSSFLMLLCRSYSMKKAVISSITVSIVAIFLVSLFLPESTRTRFIGSYDESGQFDSSTEGRFFYWNTALKIIKDYPLGVGTGQIRSAMQKYTGGASVYTGTGKYVDPHNGFLHTVCEYGLIGLLIFLWFLWTVFKESRAFYLDKRNPIVYRTYALGIVGMIGALVVCNMFYSNFYKDLVLGSLMIHFGMFAYVVAWKKSVSGTI